jgi:hypothetical protein
LGNADGEGLPHPATPLIAPQTLLIPYFEKFSNLAFYTVTVAALSSADSSQRTVPNIGSANISRGRMKNEV